MKLRTKILGATVIATMLFGAMSASAYTKGYTFTVHSFLNGATVFSLQNKSTNTQLTTLTLNSSEYTINESAKFTVELYKNYLNKYPVSASANGTKYTLSFGTVPEGDYTINVYKNGSEGYYVDSQDATINQ